MKRKARERKKDRVRKGVSGRGRWRERCEVNCEIKLEVKTAEMFKSTRGCVFISHGRASVPCVQLHTLCRL